MILRKVKSAFSSLTLEPTIFLFILGGFILNGAQVRFRSSTLRFTVDWIADPHQFDLVQDLRGRVGLSGGRVRESQRRRRRHGRIRGEWVRKIGALCGYQSPPVLKS